MAKEPRPKGYPKLKNYKPSQFMLPTSHYDKKKADRAVTFIENLCHTKGKWAGTPFWLLPWQEQLIRDIFGIVKPDGNRQFRTAFVEICKKVGKSELAAAVALYLLYADNEPSAEVYGAAADRQQASIVFDVAKQMVEMSPALMKRSKLMGATKRIVNYSNAGYYQVLSAEVGGKHGFSVSGLVFDEIHTQPNRQLYDVLTKGSSDARQNPLHFIITTAGNDRHSIAYELHTKAVDILEGLKGCTDYKKAVQIIKDGGYATSLTYVEKLCGIIERWNLTKWDVKNSGSSDAVVKYYRVRKAWKDAGSQLGAYTVLDNAKAMADKHEGYTVYDWNGKAVYGAEVAGGSGLAAEFSNADCPFMVKVSIDDLNIRKGAGTNTAKTGRYTGKGVFTIMEVKNGKGSDNGWGRLKSGAGWISLDYCQKI